MAKRIIELEPGVWLASGEGDPPRSLDKANALVFDDYEQANLALTFVRRLYGRSFEYALTHFIEGCEDD